MIWHIIKAQTALGKTHVYLEFLQNTSRRVLIVAPTNKLKHEVGTIRAAKFGIELMESPSLHEIEDLIPDDVWDEIEFLYASGKSVIPCLKRIIKEDYPICAALFKQYLEELDEFKKYEGHAITTHKRFLTMDVSKYDLVIIDEDIILGSIIQNKIDIRTSELEMLKKETTPGGAVGKKIDKALKYIRAEDKASDFFTLPAIDFDEEGDGIAMGVDIPSFCSATHFLHRRASDKENKIDEDCITFIKPVEFKPNTKYIMVSATVDEKVCGYYFGEDNMEFYECKKARYEGKLLQDHRRSMSRADISKAPGIIEQIKKWSGFKHTISFKRFMDYYDGELHFGNCAGCDYMKGEDIDVIGTPHISEWIYKLFAFTMGCEFDTEAKIRPGLTVEHNGWKFRFTTYEDEVLRAIQFYIIESQLEQAVGRARLLRKYCTVYLISNFPLFQSNMEEFGYDNHAADDGMIEDK